MGVQSVTHQLELSVGPRSDKADTCWGCLLGQSRNEGNRAVVLESSEPYTLMELDVLRNNSRVGVKTVQTRRAGVTVSQCSLHLYGLSLGHRSSSGLTVAAHCN